MSLRRVLLVAILSAFVGLSLLSAFYWLSRGRIEESFRARLVQSFDRWTGEKSSIQALSIHFFPPRILISHLRIDARQSQTDIPLVSIPVIEVRPRWRDLWLLSFQIARLRIVEPSVHLVFDQNGSLNFSSLSDRFDPFLLQIRHVSVENGNIQINKENLAWSVELEGVRLSADRPLTRESYVTQIGYKKGSVRWGKVSLTGTIDLTCEWLRDQIKVQRLVMKTSNSEMEAEGVFEYLLPLRGTILYRGHVQLSDIHQLAPQFREVNGRLNLHGQFEFSSTKWRTDGILEGQKLLMKHSQVDRLRCSFFLNSKQFEFQQIQLEGLKGRASGSLRIDNPFQARRFTADLTIKGIDVTDLVRLAGVTTLTPTGQVQGSLHAAWSDQWRGFSGEGHLSVLPSSDRTDIPPSTNSLLPISGAVNFTVNGTSLLFHDTQLQLRQSQLKLEGSISPTGDSSVKLEFRSADLSDFVFVEPELRGEAYFDGSILGNRRNPELEGQFLFRHLSTGKYQADEVTGSLRADRQEMKLSHTTVTKGNSRVRVQGRLPINPANFLPSGDMNLEVIVRNSLTGDLLSMVGRSFPVSGKINGELQLSGNYRQPYVVGDLLLSQCQFFGQPIVKANLAIRYQDPKLEILRFTAGIGPGLLKGSAEVNFQEQTMHTSIQGSALSLQDLQWVQSHKTRLAGTIQRVSLEAGGSLRRPALKGELELKALTIAGEAAGDFSVKIDTADQISSFSIVSLDRNVQLKANGAVELNDDLDLSAQLSFDNLLLTPYLQKVLPVTTERFTSQAAGEVVIRGPLLKPERLAITGSLRSLKIKFREAQLQSSKAFEIAVVGEKVSLQSAEFTGKGTILTLNGSVDLTNRGQLDLAMKGDFDLALLNEFVKNLTASGSGTVNALVRGTLRDPRVQGQGKVSNAQFGYAGFPNTLSQTNGTVFFDENQIRIENITGTSGSGKITTTGSLIFGEEKIKMLNLRVQCREVRIRYPEGMRNVVDADLTLRGSQQSQVLSGNIRVLSASFQKGYDPITQFLENRSSSISWPGTKDFGNLLNLDLTIGGDRNIKLDTPLIRTSARADMKVKGTAARPLVTGGIEASEGEIYFQGVRYRLTRGRVEFINPVRIDPRIDLEAEGDVRDYRIVLNLSGTVEKLRANIRSDPPLPTVDIFNLVATGGSGRSGTTSSSYRPYTTGGLQQDSSTGAASLLTEGLSLKMGSRVKRIFGLDRFRVDPFLVGNERDPATRVTFGQQVTKKLSITYSTNVSTNEQQVIFVEYYLNDFTTVIGSRDANGEFGLDIRFRKRLRQRNR